MLRYNGNEDGLWEMVTEQNKCMEMNHQISWQPINPMRWKI